MSPLELIDAMGVRTGESDPIEGGPLRAATTMVDADLDDCIALDVSPRDVAAVDRPLATSTHALRSDSHLQIELVAPAADGPWPLVVFLPGGGFLTASRHSGEQRRHVVAARGFAVASVEYRTIRDGVWSDAVSDVHDAIDLLRGRRDEFGLAADRIAIWGESAGGFVGAHVALAGRPDVVAMIDVFGLTDLSRVAADFDEAERDRHHTPDIPEAKFVFGRHSGMTIDDDPAAVQRANPVRAVHAGAPPFLLMHGSRDGLVSPSQTQLLHQALRAHGADSTRYVVRGAGHYGPEWRSGTVLDLITDFLVKHTA